MSENNPVSEDQRILNEVTTRAAVDSAFRQRLMTNPNAALSEVAGRPVPSTFKVKFIEKSPELDALVVLPDLVDENAELSAEELEAVAGGVAGSCWITCLVESCTALSSITGAS